MRILRTLCRPCVGRMQNDSALAPELARVVLCVDAMLDSERMRRRFRRVCIKVSGDAPLDLTSVATHFLRNKLPRLLDSVLEA